MSGKMQLKYLGKSAICALLGISIPGIAMAKDKDDDNTPPAIFQDVLDCKAIAEPENRLACYDNTIAVLENAQASRQVVIADREQIKEARRGLFGFSLPKLKLFGGDSEDKEERVKELNTVIKSVRQVGYGRWRFTLEEGGQWLQSDNERLIRDPRPGDEILIKTGAVGSYLAKVNGARAFRIKRIN